jgi:MFS-type transporter involved in bile tolerance (Atg22 family)
MSVSATGLALAAELAEDSQGTNAELEPVSTPGDVQPIAPDQFDPRYETTKLEIWAYYAYYVGNNGLTLFNFAPTAFQNLLYEQAGDAGLIHFLGQDRDINSVVLLANGISFAIQVVLFLVLGSFADYGTWRPYILIFWSIVAFGLGFGWLGVHTVDKWPVATGLYMIGLIAYQMCITFWTAAFPGLARNTPELRRKAEQYEASEINREQYDFADMMQRNRIQNVAFIVQSAGEILILAVIVGIMWGLNVNASTANNNWGLSVLIAFATGVWLLLAIPLFVIEKRRPGQPLPPNMNIVSVGFWQLYRAFRQIWRLKQSLLYLVGEFGNPPSPPPNTTFPTANFTHFPKATSFSATL